MTETAAPAHLPGEPMPRGLCWCGCGRRTNVTKETNAPRGLFAGVPNRYLPGHYGRPSLRTRLFRQLVIDPSGCLLWTGRTDPSGYGRIKIGNRDHPVHCVMYEMFVEPIPDGLELDHVRDWGCRNRNCASPAHLEPVTKRENALRRERALQEQGRDLGSRRRRGAA